MASSTSNIPWSEIGSETARTLIAECDKMSRTFADALEGVRGATIPDFQSAKWRYEFCIFIMFWLWYVANSPKFTRDGATKPLLDAYHRECCRAFLQANLIENTRDALRRWEDDVEARFLSYKDAYDGRLADIREDPYLQSLNITGRGTVGWLLVHQMFPGAQPDSRVVVLLNEFGSLTFTGLVEIFTNLEKLARTKPRWKSLFPSTLTRKQYMIRWLVMVAVVVAATFLLIGAPQGAAVQIAAIVFWVSVLAAFLYNIFGLSIPRLRSAQISLWALLLLFIPLGPLLMFVVCVAAREKV